MASYERETSQRHPSVSGLLSGRGKRSLLFPTGAIADLRIHGEVYLRAEEARIPRLHEQRTRELHCPTGSDSNNLPVRAVLKTEEAIRTLVRKRRRAIGECPGSRVL